MNLIIFRLLIGFSTIISINSQGKTRAFLSEDELIAMADDRTSLYSESKRQLILVGHKSLGKNDKTFVWKGAYGEKEVAVKMVDDNSKYKQELSIYRALHAFENASIEKKGIPNVYCHGSFISWIGEPIYFMAITFFDESLESRSRIQRQSKKNISDFSLSWIFKRSTEVLQYIHSMNVIHNDIKPGNIFLRGTEVFIGDFDMAKPKGESTSGCTRKFASLNRLRFQQRTEIDDLESLVFSIWDVAGVKCRHPQTHGGLLSESINNGNLESKIKENCQHFKNKCIQEAFEGICIAIFKRQDFIYERISKKLTSAAQELFKITRQSNFEWLDTASSSGSS